MRNFGGLTSLYVIYKENKKALLDLQYPLEYIHGLSANAQNINPPLLRITVMVSPLFFHLA